jgi:hypothetical protein
MDTTKLKKLRKRHKYPDQFEDFSNLPTEIAQFELSGISKEYSNFLIKERRIKKLIRLSSILPILGIYICDKYSHRWYIMNKSFVYFVNLISSVVSLSFLIYLFIFAL